MNNYQSYVYMQVVCKLIVRIMRNRNSINEKHFCTADQYRNLLIKESDVKLHLHEYKLFLFLMKESMY